MRKIALLITAAFLTGCNGISDYSTEQNIDGSTPRIVGIYDGDILEVYLTDKTDDETIESIEVTPSYEQIDDNVFRIPENSNNERVCFTTNKRIVCDTVHR